jgi:6-hydroxycyclohex-1-ene-1-carbonyl-CoA dehydrogenase
MEILAWTVTDPKQPMTPCSRQVDLRPADVLVEVAGCGVCHTDLGFYYDGVPTRHGFPLALGHEVSGTVVATGADATAWLHRDVIVPAVIPCGECAACKAGRGSICPQQIFPGNDVHGGFATHLEVPARGLCPVPDLTVPAVNPGGIDLATLSVIADAVSTPYQAVLRSGLEAGDLAVFVGAGGVGGFGVQIAAALGARVVAIDVDDQRLALIGEHGAALTLDSQKLEFRDLRQAVRAFADEHGVPTWRRRIFETSGTVAGQQTAFGLLEHGGYLSVVGFTADKVEVRLSNLMAFDARAEGNWGCLPEHYPGALDLVLSSRVAIEPFVEQRALSTINETFADLHQHRVSRRIILIPEQ